MIIIVNN